MVASVLESWKVIGSTSGRDGRRPDAEEVHDFIDQWRLTDSGFFCFQRLPSKLLGVIIRTFDAPCDLAVFDGVFIEYVVSLVEALKNSAILIVPEVQAFMTYWAFEVESRNKLPELPAQLIGFVVRSFAPESEGSTWNAKFNDHAMSMERAWHNRGLDSYRAAVHVLLSPGEPSTRRRATRHDCGTVVVMNPHNSCTHAMVE